MRARRCGGAGFRTFWRPVFRWEGDAPELRTRGGEFEADFGSIPAHGPEENDVALLLFECFLVLKLDGSAAGEARAKKNQSAVSADGKGLGFFVKGSPICVGAAQAYGHLHQHALAASLWSGMNWRVGTLSHASSQKFILQQ